MPFGRCVPAADRLVKETKPLTAGTMEGHDIIQVSARV